VVAGNGGGRGDIECKREREDRGEEVDRIRRAVGGGRR